MVAKIVVQPMAVPVGTFMDRDGKAIWVVVSREWQRTFEQMARMINDQQTAIEALEARVTALE